MRYKITLVTTTIGFAAGLFVYIAVIPYIIQNIDTLVSRYDLSTGLAIGGMVVSYQEITHKKS